MRGRSLFVAAVTALALAGGAWWLLDRAAGERVDDGAPAVPGLAARVEAIDRIEVAGAGGGVLVALHKRDGTWRMPSKLDWPANQREVGNALYRLGNARRLEAKTADPSRHARLGVEDVSLATAKGAELRLHGGGEPLRLVVGNNHPALGGSYVRLGDDPQAWLIDEDVAPVRDPAAWLDRRLLDLPMARVERIAVRPATGPAFVLARVEDRFTPDGLRPADLANMDDGNATAGFTDQLAFDDVAADDGSDATQAVTFETVDGLRVQVEAWPADGGTWARLSATLDETQARQWLSRAGTAAESADGSGDETRAGAVADADADSDADSDADAEAEADADATVEPAAVDAAAATAVREVDVEAELARMRDQLAQWQARFDGHRFLLPPYKAQHLMKSRSDYVDGGR